MEIDPQLLWEKLEALERYNRWEERVLREDLPDLAARLAWLEEAYELARRMGALPPLPADPEAWRVAVAGVREMQKNLARIRSLDA
ncbi:MAG: hypothetical protein K6U03_05690 [Firmicutes bacterium]|nr:hypothetical protein [Bacillota bacterium]